MAGHRSPFGELLRWHRRDRLGLSQEELVDRITALNKQDPTVELMTVRTISRHEQSSDPSRWTRPQRSTVRTLARALDLVPGSPEHTAFLDAAFGPREPTPGPAAPPPAEPREAPDTEARRLLLVASVQGPAFLAEPLMNILDLTPEAWQMLVDEHLVRRARTLVPAGTEHIAGHTVHRYAFADPGFRDHLYDTHLTDLERTWHHRSTADAMLAVFGNGPHDAAATIARHFELGHEPTRAARAWVRAGIHELTARRFTRAIEYFSRVGRLGARRSAPDTYIESLIGLGNSERGLGDRARARRHHQRALDLAARHTLPELRANALESLALIDFDGGDMEAGARRLAAVVDLWLGLGSDVDAARALANQSLLLYGMGHYDRAAEAAQRSAAIAIRIGDDGIWADARIALGICRLDIGCYDEAGDIFEQCLEVCIENDDTHREQLCWYNLSILAFEQERWQVAREAALRIVEAHVDRTVRIVGAAEFNLGIAAEGLNDVEAAATHYATSRAIRARHEQQALLIDSLAGLLRVAMARGERDRVRELQEDILHRVDERGLDGVEHLGRLFATLIEAALELGNDAEARSMASRAVTVLAERAGQLTRPEHRASYLADVPSHRQLLELARSLGIEPVEEPGELSAVLNEVPAPARIEDLPPEMRHALRVASVQGTSFAAEPLMRIIGISRPQAIAMLDDRLVREHNILQPAESSEIDGAPVHSYRFVDPAERSSLYEDMTSLERAHHHIATAEAMMELYGRQGHAGTPAIARHLELAGERRRAADAWIAAGDWVYSRGDYAVAQDHYRRASNLVRQSETPGIFAQALVGLANCARALAVTNEAHALVDRALAIARRRHLPNVIANALSTRGMLAFDEGETDAGARDHAAAIDRYLEAGNRREAARSMANLSYSLHAMGLYSDALAFAERGLDLARRIGDDGILIDATIARANCLIDIGLYDAAIAEYESCRVICDDVGDIHSDNLCLLNIALCSFETAQWERGEAAVETVLEPGRPTAIRLVGAARFNLAVIAEGRGDDPATVRAHYEASRQIREDTGQHKMLIDSLAGLLRVALVENRIDEAGALRDDIQARVEAGGLDGVEHPGRLFVTLIEASRALGGVDEARTKIRRAVAFLTWRADRLKDPIHRQSYLTRVPAHCRVFELAADLDAGA